MTKQARARKGSGFHSCWLAVYDGQTCIGHLLARGRSGVEVFGADDESLGVYPTQKEAMQAVTEARKRAWSTPTLTEITDPETIAAIRRDEPI
jgi:hypothetical protein